jgi:transposase
LTVGAEFERKRKVGLCEILPMPFRKISPDVKLAAIRLYERHLLPLQDILDCLGFSERTFYRILHLWWTTGDIVRHTNHVAAGPRKLVADDVDYLKWLINHRPDWFLDELLHLLATNRFISVHYTTIHRELERAGVSVKKLPWSEVKSNVQPLLHGWPSTTLKKLAFSMKHQKTSEQWHEDMDVLGRGVVHRCEEFMFEGDVFQQQGC